MAAKRALTPQPLSRASLVPSLGEGGSGVSRTESASSPACQEANVRNVSTANSSRRASVTLVAANY
eukprot:6211849-Pleurochrysis_carterae.AAC.6